MFSKKFLHNDPDSYQDAKISLHDCQFHIPYSVATYRWNQLRKDIVF